MNLPTPITITGAGPAPVTLPSLRCALVGPSGAGKSRTLAALCGLLTDRGPDGSPYPRQLIEPTEPVTVTLGGAPVPSYVRDHSAGRTTPRISAPAGLDLVCQPHTLAQALQIKPGTVQAQRLARDVSDVLPGPSASDVLARELRHGEPSDEKSALAWRREHQRAADRAAGTASAEAEAAERAQRALDEATEAHDPDAAERARAWLAEHMDAAGGDAAAWDAAARAVREWDARRHQILEPETPRPEGERPAPPEPATPPPALYDAVDKARAARREAHAARLRASEAHAQARTTAARAESEVYDLRRRLQAHEDHPPQPPGPPPACAGLQGCSLAAQHDRRVQDYEEALELHQQRRETLEARIAEAEGLAAEAREAAESASYAVESAQDDADAAEVAEEDATERLRAAQDEAREATEQARREHEQQIRTWDAWEAYDAALGRLGDRPADPEGQRPEVDLSIVERAQSRIRDEEHRAAAVASAEAALSEATERAATAAAARDAAEAAAERAAEVVELVRAAPARALEESLAPVREALAGTGVDLVIEGGGLSATYEGRPWATASTGERVRGCALIRAAIRDAVSLDGYPVIVDDAQSWSGDLAEEISGPLILSVTSEPSEAEGLQVVAL